MRRPTFIFRRDGCNVQYVDLLCQVSLRFSLGEPSLAPRYRGPDQLLCARPSAFSRNTSRRIAVQNGMIHPRPICPASVRALREPTLLFSASGIGYRNRKWVGDYPLDMPETPDTVVTGLTSRFHDNESPAPIFSSIITKNLFRAD